MLHKADHAAADGVATEQHQLAVRYILLLPPSWA